MVTVLRGALLAGLLIAAGCQADKMKTAQMDRALFDLKTTPRLFVCDGAHDFHVDLNEPASVKTLLTRGGINVLIEHLDDTTLTETYMHRTEQDMPVPLGYLCLDLLLQISAADSPVFAHPDAADDDPWPTVDEKYFFFPAIPDAETRLEQMKRVRAEWERLVGSGRAVFMPL